MSYPYCWGIYSNPRRYKMSSERVCQFTHHNHLKITWEKRWMNYVGKISPMLWIISVRPPTNYALNNAEQHQCPYANRGFQNILTVNNCLQNKKKNMQIVVLYLKLITTFHSVKCFLKHFSFDTDTHIYLLSIKALSLSSILRTLPQSQLALNASLTANH